MDEDSPRRPDDHAGRDRQRYTLDDFGDDPLSDTGPIGRVSDPDEESDPADAARAAADPVERGTEPLLDEPLRAAPPARDDAGQALLFDDLADASEPVGPALPPPRPRPAGASRRRHPEADDDADIGDRRPLIAVAAVVAALVVVAIVVAVVGGGSGGDDQAGGSPGGPVFAGASTSAGASATDPATSASPTTAATTTPAASATAAVSTVAPKDVPLTVLNNTTVTGLASAAAQEFAGHGWDIGMIGNYTGAIPTTTVYYVPSDNKQERAAQTLAAQFPKVAKVEPRRADLPGSGLTVVIAPDWKS